MNKKSLRRTLLGSAIAAAMVPACLAAGSARSEAASYQHVLLISVDGLHAVDLNNMLADTASKYPTLKLLSQHGVMYPNALTTAPSDSFPGMIAQTTGGTPYSAGVFYDDSYDRTLFAPGSACKGLPGTETNYAENIDDDLTRVDAGGTLGQPLTQIDPAKLPLSLQNGKCVPVYPHQFIRTNTIFEVIRAHGGYTAWADKHPAYDILNGPSGKGIEDLYTPEVNAQIPGAPAGDDNTTSYSATRGNDELKVQAVLNEIDGRSSDGKKLAPVPSIMGMNFQSVSVGQKLATSGYGDAPGLVGGYVDANATPASALSLQLDYVDTALGRMVQELRARGLFDSTLIIVSAKHGQSPIDRSVRRAIDDTPFTKTPGYGFHIADDEALIWLKPQTQKQYAASAEAYLNANAPQLGIQYLLERTDLRQIYQDPQTDSRTPDFIAVSTHGVIYTTGTKLAEHGGFSYDDRNVALLVSNPRLTAGVDVKTVETRQIAPTILTALGLNPTELNSVRVENTQVLPDLQ